MDKLELKDIAWTTHPDVAALDIPDGTDNFYLKIITNMLRERKYLDEIIKQKDELIEQLSINTKGV